MRIRPHRQDDKQHRDHRAAHDGGREPALRANPGDDLGSDGEQRSKGDESGRMCRDGECDQNSRGRERPPGWPRDESECKGQYGDEQQRNDRLGSKCHAPGEGVEQEGETQRPLGALMLDPVEEAGENAAGHDPDGSEQGERRQAHDEEHIRVRHDPVLEPLAPVVERKARSICCVVVREAAGGRAVRLPHLHPAVVVEDGSDDPPAEKKKRHDAVDGPECPAQARRGCQEPRPTPAHTRTRVPEDADERGHGERDRRRPRRPLPPGRVRAVREGRHGGMGCCARAKVEAAEEAGHVRSYALVPMHDLSRGEPE